MSTHPTDESIDEQTQAASSPAENTTAQCPECASNTVTESGEQFCPDCGIIVSTNHVDTTPQWSTNNEEQKRHTGRGLSVAIHDYGLHSTIGRNVDSYGNKLSQKKRTKLRRLRRLHRWARGNYNGGRSLRGGLTEIHRMASALGLGKPVVEIAATIYRRAYSKEILHGHPKESIAAAAVYLAARINRTPRTYDQIENVCRVEILQVKRDQRHLLHELDLEVEPTLPGEFVVPFASRLDLPEAHIRTAQRMLHHLNGAEISGKAPTALAATALYAAGLSLGRIIRQRPMSDALPVSRVTLRNLYPLLLGKDPGTPMSLDEADRFTSRQIVCRLHPQGYTEVPIPETD